ncbi:WXG100 family type VII secretion target [Nocardia sp. NPDC051833]|uniref:WXG100 family type VII secretion target n=1 Tax=Nocardia sp. NPDC051833 TaxID=3155674 RepID=UPI00343831E4
MAGKVEITPAKLRSAAGQMADLRNDVQGILTRLQSSLDTHGSPWGGDGYGTSFAAGDTGYLAARENMFTAVGNMAATIGSYADGQRQAATRLETQDRL